MKRAEWWVWCDFYAEPHEQSENDPYDEGPMRASYDGAQDFPEGAWSWHEDQFDGYEGNLWHFTCPGKHSKLWIGALT